MNDGAKKVAISQKSHKTAVYFRNSAETLSCVGVKVRDSTLNRVDRIKRAKHITSAGLILELGF